ncbi:hypothetical protein, partial [Thalassotalea ganghwensis]
AYALATRANEGQPATNQAELNQLEANLDGQALLELAAAIKSIVDDENATLPDGVDSVLDLALDEEQANAAIEALSESELQALFAEMASDPELVAPLDAEVIPEQVRVNFSKQQFSNYYGGNPDNGWILELNTEDNVGQLITHKTSPLNKLFFTWTVDDSGSQIITFDEPPTQSITMGEWINGARVNVPGVQTLTQLRMQQVHTSATSSSYIVQATYKAEYENSQYNRSGDSFSLTATAYHQDPVLTFTEEELTADNATFAVPYITEDNNTSIIVADVITLNGDRTVTSSQVTGAMWSLENGDLVLTLANNEKIKYQKVQTLYEGVNRVQVTRYNASGDVDFAYADIMVSKQADVAITESDLTSNYWHFLDEGIDIGGDLDFSGLLNSHYSYWYNWTDSGREYYTIFYSDLWDARRQRTFTDDVFSDGTKQPLAFWFYNTGVGIEYYPNEDKGSFESNLAETYYYQEWQLSDGGNLLVSEGFIEWQAEPYQKYEIKPLRKIDDMLFVHMRSMVTDTDRVYSDTITFFTLKPRTTVNSNPAPVLLQKPSASWLNRKQEQVLNAQ